MHVSSMKLMYHKFEYNIKKETEITFIEQIIINKDFLLTDTVLNALNVNIHFSLFFELLPFK